MNAYNPCKNERIVYALVGILHSRLHRGCIPLLAEAGDPSPWVQWKRKKRGVYDNIGTRQVEHCVVGIMLEVTAKVFAV
jgi:hypothetical protein